jgi:hypothetical protein
MTAPAERMPELIIDVLELIGDRKCFAPTKYQELFARLELSGLLALCPCCNKYSVTDTGRAVVRHHRALPKLN